MSLLTSLRPRGYDPAGVGSYGDELGNSCQSVKFVSGILRLGVENLFPYFR